MLHTKDHILESIVCNNTLIIKEIIEAIEITLRLDEQINSLKVYEEWKGLETENRKLLDTLESIRQGNDTN